MIGITSKVLFLKYGNMIRRVHSSKAVKAGSEYNNPNDGNEAQVENGPEENTEVERNNPSITPSSSANQESIDNNGERNTQTNHENNESKKRYSPMGCHVKTEQF